jgi:hypothetical protein
MVNPQKCLVSIKQEDNAMPTLLGAFIVLLAMGMGIGPVTTGATDFVSSNAADVAAFQF